MRRARWTTASLVVAIAVACTPVTAPTGSSTLVNGTWSYLATNSAAPLVVSGSLNITPRSGSSFGGRLDGTESGDALGDHLIVGYVSGRVQDSALLFDVTLGDDIRQHSGKVRGDSLVGTWVETSSGMVLASGAFRAKRVQ